MGDSSPLYCSGLVARELLEFYGLFLDIYLSILTGCHVFTRVYTLLLGSYYSILSGC